MKLSELEFDDIGKTIQFEHYNGNTLTGELTSIWASNKGIDISIKIFDFEGPEYWISKPPIGCVEDDPTIMFIDPFAEA